MRSWACQVGFAVLAVALAPLAGMAPRAQAGYLLTDPGLRSAAGGNGICDAGAGMGGAASGERLADPREPRHGDGNGPQSPSPLDRLSQARDAWWMALGQSGTGAGSTSPLSSGSGSGLPAAVGVRFALPPAQVAGWFYIDDLESRPPPFPSRLFRPPRSV
jgi:hypothetical protein